MINQLKQIKAQETVLENHGKQVMLTKRSEEQKNNVLTASNVTISTSTSTSTTKLEGRGGQCTVC